MHRPVMSSRLITSTFDLKVPSSLVPRNSSELFGDSQVSRSQRRLLSLVAGQGNSIGKKGKRDIVGQTITQCLVSDKRADNGSGFLAR